MKRVIITFVMFLFSLSSWGQIVTLPQVEIMGLEPYAYQSVTLYYALGTPASIALSPEQVNIREIRAKTTIAIENQTRVVTPKMNVAIQGFTVPYNMS